MIRNFALLALAGGLLAPPPAAAAVTARNTIPAGTVLAAADLSVDPRISGELGDPAEAVGLQLRSTVYAGRAIPAAGLAPPTLVERNQTVVLAYARGGLVITTEGRALGRGGAGETIRVLNTASRVTVTATIQPDGTLAVEHRP